MPALLRFALTLPPLVVVALGGVVLALADAPQGLLAAGSSALALLVVPPLLAGVFVSYWAWEGDARRRLRVCLSVLAAVQLAAAVGFALVLVALPSALPAGLGVLALALSCDPFAVLLGRAARRREPRLVVRTDLDGVRAAIRTAWRRAGIGAAIGLAFGILLVTVLGLGLAGGDLDWRLGAFVLLFTGLGASLAASFGSLAVGRRVREVIGEEWTSSRRIGRAVRGKPEELSPEDADRAARYAAVAPDWLRLQTLSQLTNAVLPLVLAANAVGSDSGLAGFLLVCAALTLATALTAVVLIRGQMRRIRAYAAEHPVPATP
ncbi:hypothetical protein [Amnibacterium setariae]|uniref:Uncharacterized protein n=1 Tax=Amnibacterium setariae TaxID=2306585 RepID=A0A3A1U8Y9_9MICO|nr:hypothetical protein [Amnibacterium setariae]RIX30709.1 hypothetical protein D1781_04685 [Amnibacterium setariae]